MDLVIGLVGLFVVVLVMNCSSGVELADMEEKIVDSDAGVALTYMMISMCHESWLCVVHILSDVAQYGKAESRYANY